MALPGYYLINFTDPRKQSFVIEPYQTDGGITPTSSTPHGLARRISTSMLLYGRDVPNYGERIAENFVHLLENFAGPTQPNSPIEGQLWFDTGSSYEVIAWTNFNTLTLQGDHQARFAQYIADSTVLSLAFRPANAAVDNSHQTTQLIATTVSVSMGNTVVTFTATSGDPIELPATVVGGFVTADTEHYSRMRVATKVGSELKWVDVTNVYSSEDEPEVHHRMVGDLWFDSASEQLNVYGTSGWASVAAKYLPLAGGSLTGDLQLGPNRVFSSAVTDNTPAHQYALVNRKHVDVLRDSLQAQIDEIQNNVSDIVNVQLVGKVSKAGDVMSGALLFGDEDATTTLDRGIDMNGTPITRVLSPTWNASDYLSASFQPLHAITKQYVAQAFTQHLADEAHGAGGFVEIQGDGTGLLPNTVFFNAGTAGTSYALKWKDISGNNEHSIYSNFSGATSQLVIEAGMDPADSVDIRHSLHSPASDPLFRFMSSYTRSYNSIYIHDGQPQPLDNDVPTAIVDDNKAATKGFVRQYVADFIPETDPDAGGASLTAVNFGYELTQLKYTMIFTQTSGTPIVVDMYHEHPTTDITMEYEPSEELFWDDVAVDHLTDFLEEVSPDYPVVNVQDYLNGVAAYRAPIINARFVDLPRTGDELEIVGYDTATSRIHIRGLVTGEVPVGFPVALVHSNGNDGVYTVTAITAGPVIEDEEEDEVIETCYITVSPNLLVNGPEVSENATLHIGAYATREHPTAFVTRSTLDYEIAAATETKYTTWKATSSGTNVLHTLPFSYKVGSHKLWVFKNGVKQRVNIMTGGDFNETSPTSVTLATVNADDQFEIYVI